MTLLPLPLQRWLARCRHKTLAGLTGVVLGSLFGFALILWGSRASPLVITSAYELDDVVTRSGHIDIVLNLDRNRNCPSETSRWIWTWVDSNGKRTKQLFPLPSSGGIFSETDQHQRFIVSLPLPQGIWPGKWYYWSRTIEHCSFFPFLSQYNIVETPQIPIQVMDDP